MYHQHSILAICRQKVRKPGSSNALERRRWGFFRFGGGGPLAPAYACGCRRKIAGPRNPSPRYVASAATLRAVPISVQIRAHLQKSVRHEIFRSRHCRLASLCVWCGRNPRHRYGTVAFRPAKENSPRPRCVVSVSIRTTSESGGVGRATVPTGSGASWS